MTYWALFSFCVLLLIMLLATISTVKALKVKVTRMETDYGGTKHNHERIEEIWGKVRDLERAGQWYVRDTSKQYGYSTATLKDVLVGIFKHLNVTYIRNPESVAPKDVPLFMVVPAEKKKGKKNG